MNTEVTRTKQVILRKKELVPQSPVLMVQKLREFAGKSPAFSAMAHAFAMRERTRQQITIHSLIASMVKEGYNFTKDEYRQALTFMANLKLGNLERDRKGQVSALKGITYTLQSIGLASVSKKDSLAKNSVGTPFRQLPSIVPMPQFEDSPKVVVKDPLLKKPLKETTLIIKIGYKTFNFDLFPESSIKEVIETIDRIYQNKDKKA